MSLFTKLLNLHSGSQPLEDFFTEVIAYFLELNQHILINWLKESSIINDNDYKIKLTTQKYYEPLKHHQHGSQVDIVLELENDFKTDVIFIESKIGSTEGCEQLKKYAEILSNLSYPKQRTLIYITRDYEPKNKIEITNYLSPKVAFYQLRWYQLYAFLQRKSDDALSKEILVFMRKHGMSHTNQFSPIDLITMMNFNNTLKSMQATISDEVEKEFKLAFGNIKKGPASMTQWRWHGRYIIYTHLSQGGNFWCGLGYFHLNPDISANYPKIGVNLEVSPSFKHRSEIIQAMKKVVSDKPDTWIPHNLTFVPNWSSIFYQRDLQDFVANQNHISELKLFFLESIKELKSVQEN